MDGNYTSEWAASGGDGDGDADGARMMLIVASSSVWTLAVIVYIIS